MCLEGSGDVLAEANWCLCRALARTPTGEEVASLSVKSLGAARAAVLQALEAK